MGKKRIYELAKEINVASKDILETANKKGYDLKNHMATIDDNQEKTEQYLWLVNVSSTNINN